MYKVLDTAFAGINGSLKDLAPIVKEYGINAIGIPQELYDDENAAIEAAKMIEDLGLRWGIIDTPADFYTDWDVDDAAFDKAVEQMKRRADLCERMHADTCYNHVWPGSNIREFDANFEWHVRRIKRVQKVMDDHGISYGLEMLAPHDLVSSFKYRFATTLTGGAAISDACGGRTKLLFDTFHWYCGGSRDDELAWALQNKDRIICIHINDARAGIPVEEQKDLQRANAMTTGVIDAKGICAKFKAAGYNGPVMNEPIEPCRTEYLSMDPEEAIKDVAAAFARTL